MKKFLIHQTLVKICAILLCILGLSVIIGWYFQWSALIQIHPKFAPMQFNTALGFMVLGIAILALHRDRKITIGCASIALLLGGLTLIQYVFQVDLYIDQLFMKHNIVVATSHPGRMAPNTALNFVLSGTSLLIISQRNSKNSLLLTSILGALVTALGTVAFLGYLSNVETAYGWGKLTRMAIHTSSGFMVTGLMLILQSRDLCLKNHQKLSALFFPLTLALFGFTMTIAFWQALYATKLFLVNEHQELTPNHPVATGILLFGFFLSMVMAIAVWFAIRFYEQVQALKIAQQRILALNQKLEQLSYLDGLTGIANRRFFDLTIEKEWHRAFRYQYPLALMIIDIDFFKRYNDYYGHQKGDECIKQIAHLIETMARRKTDIAARYGGEEFVLLLTNISAVDAQDIAYHLMQKVAEAKIPHKSSLIGHYITISIGLHVQIPTKDSGIDYFILQTDKALYQAKNTGRSRVVCSEFKT